MREACRDFVVHTTRAQSPTLTPELELYLAHPDHAFWDMDDDALEASYLPPPYWGFAWSGGQALARYILDHPDIVRGRRVLDFAAGSALEAIAAVRAGAEHVYANDIDPLAEAAIELNAELNRTEVEIISGDIVGSPLPHIDVVLSGDICYEGPLADRVMAWFRELTHRGVLVLVGDPGRAYLPKMGLEELARYHPDEILTLEDGDLRRAAVHRVLV